MRETSSVMARLGNDRFTKDTTMGQPIVHFEIIGGEPEKLRRYYGELFGWQFDMSHRVSQAVSEPTNYGFVSRDITSDGTGIPGGVGGGSAYHPRATFYVCVPDAEAALRDAERLGGTRAMGPERAPSGLVVGHFRDPEGNLVGVAQLP
jgi:predicted enzyme related to lactoylglutathione lyase